MGTLLTLARQRRDTAHSLERSPVSDMSRSDLLALCEPISDIRNRLG